MVAWGCTMSSIAYAQQSRIAIQRLVMDEAISTIEDYESFATIADDEIRYSFEELFVDENAIVYNDLLGISKEETLTVKEYSKKLSDGLRNKKATIKNIKKEGMWHENESWKVQFSFDKTMSFINKCGVLFSSSEFYDKDYHLTATLIYDEMTRKCKIESIVGSVDSPKRLSEDFFAFKKEDKRDQQLTYRNQRMTFNSYGQALLDGTYNKNAFRYSDPDVELIPIIDECNIVSMKYKARKMRIKIHYDMGIGESLDLSNTDRLSSYKTKSSSYGIDFGYVFPSKNSIKTGVFLGVGLAQSTIDTEFSSHDYFYSSNADVDGDNYIRHYMNFSLKQKVKLTEVTIPFYVDINIKLHQFVSLYFDAGVMAYLNIGHKVDNTEGNAYIYGSYPQYDNLRLDEHWGFNGFGNKAFTNKDLDNSDLVGVSSITADALGGAGLRFNIPSTPLVLDVGAKYQFGLIDIVKPEGNILSLTNNNQSPLVYNTISTHNSTEHVRNLTETFSSIKRRTLKLSIGLIYKF